MAVLCELTRCELFKITRLHAGKEIILVSLCPIIRVLLALPEVRK